MGSSIWLLLFFFVPTTLHRHLVAPTIAQDDGQCTMAAEFCWKCSDIGNYANGSIYQQNLISLLSSFSSNQSDSGFYNSSLGQDPNKVNAIALCRGDLGLESCRSCVNDSAEIILRNCSGKKEAILWSEPCMIRYSQNFIFSINVSVTPTPAPAPAPAPAPPKPVKKTKIKKIIIILIAVMIALVTLLFGGAFIFLRVKQPRVKLEDHDISEDINFLDSLQYDFENIKCATDDFSDENKLGQGGFGAVYKGRLLNRQYIAVKRLSKNSTQGDREFKNEVMLLAQLPHRNLVRLLGFCLKGEERLLIYEYIPNTSLNHFIFDPMNHGLLNWETRYKIIGGIVRGLVYLHEDSRLRIIHRDLKASNILLDDNMNPKIADFGMARMFAMDQTQGATKTIVGTYGYMAPEYAIHGRFSVKSDVFSFGVLVLEIVSGKKIGRFRNGENEEDLLSYAWRNWRDDTIPNIIDPTLITGSRNEMIRCIHIGLLCVQENSNDRPTMVSVTSMLNSHSLTLSVPSKPAYYSQYNSESDMSRLGLRLTETSDKSKSFVYVSRNEVSNITEPYPR
ncbi:cysteine-rich receptor-like protein kinase 44 [Rosa rugosa]|uniref:cysteine-rich receptor-like protein kinase 44 n=1 Tax=Rosa rugosa TaxID=74645 RepID=UPI002B40A35D|nr:cysteine-rich receptor-like protein kinase 44 [Rosa rugosa]